MLTSIGQKTVKRILIACLLLVLAIPALAQLDADGCLPTSLAPGDTARVLGAPNRVRAEPTASAAIIGEIPGSAVFTVVEIGPCTNGIRWLRVTYDGTEGWTAASADGDPFVTRVGLAGGFVDIGSGVVSLNADGTVLVVKNRLYNANDLTQPPRVLENRSVEASSLFSPLDPNLLFRYRLDSDFALIDIRDNSTLWSLSLEEPTGIAGAFSQQAYFTPDGSRVIFSSTELEYAWSVLDVNAGTTTAFERSYWGEAVAVSPDNTTFTRYVNLIYELTPDETIYLFNFDLNTLENTGELGAAQNQAQFDDLYYLPDGRLLSFNRAEELDLWEADLTHVRNLRRPPTVIVDIAATTGIVALLERTEDNLAVSLLTPDTLEEAGRLEIVMEEQSGGAILFHPDGRLGLRLGTAFRWLDTGAILDGTLTTLQGPF
ncbi:MAG: hypothetical protein OHK0046_50460 [Anaerolineae bacterium]